MARAKTPNLVSMVTGDEPDPDPDTAAGAPTDPPAGEPPPLKPDPKPRVKRPRNRKRASQTKVNEVRDELEALFTLGSGILSVRDPHCGGVLNAQSSAIATQLAEQLSTNSRIMEWFEMSVGIGGWIKLYITVKPVIDAFIGHHVTKTAGQEYDDGANPLEDFPAWTPGVDRYAS